MQNLDYAVTRSTSPYYRMNNQVASNPMGQVYSMPRRKPKKAAKKKNKAAVFFATLIWTAALLGAFSVNKGAFLDPVYFNKIKYRNIHFSAEEVYAPTLNYANNLNFMGQNILAPAPSKKERIIKIKSAGEFEALKNEIERIASNYGNLHMGLYVYDYSTGRTLDINSDEVFPAASIIKVPVLLEMFNRSKNLQKEGFAPIDLNKKITFTEAHRTEGSGDMQYGKAGVEHSIDQLAKVMIRNSDNSATNMLIEEVGGINELNASLRHWGFTKTQVTSWLPDLRGTNTTSPKEMATMLYNIDNSTFLPSKSSAAVKNYMSKVANRTLIKSQLPEDATIIHKTGDIGKMLGDAAIVQSPNGKKFIMVIMVKRPHNNYGARELIQKVSKAVYNTLG